MHFFIALFEGLWCIFASTPPPNVLSSLCRYQPTTFLGNFNEELFQETERMKDFLRRHSKVWGHFANRTPACFQRRGDPLWPYTIDERLIIAPQGELLMQRTGSTIRKHLRPCYLTPEHDDGNLHFGDFVLLQSGKTQGVAASSNT